MNRSGNLLNMINRISVSCFLPSLFIFKEEAQTSSNSSRPYSTLNSLANVPHSSITIVSYDMLEELLKKFKIHNSSGFMYVIVIKKFLPFQLIYQTNLLLH